MCVWIGELSAQRNPDFITASTLHSLDLIIQAIQMRENASVVIDVLSYYKCKNSHSLTSRFCKNYGFKPNQGEVKMQSNSLLKIWVLMNLDL